MIGKWTNSYLVGRHFVVDETKTTNPDTSSPFRVPYKDPCAAVLFRLEDFDSN